MSLANLSSSVKRDSTGKGNILISRDFSVSYLVYRISSDGWYYSIIKAVKMDGLESFLFGGEVQTPPEPYVKTWNGITFTRDLCLWRSEIADDDKGEQYHHEDMYMSASLLKNGCYIFYCDDEGLDDHDEWGCFKYDPRKQGMSGEKPWSYHPDWKKGVSLDC
jgi:hypothetical protein